MEVRKSTSKTQGSTITTRMWRVKWHLPNRLKIMDFKIQNRPRLR
jgi:hypothetical protein